MIHVQSERFDWCLWLICDCLSIVTVAMMLPVTVAMILVDEFWPLVQLFSKTNDLVCDFSWEETWCVWRLGFMPSPSFKLHPLELQEVQDMGPNCSCISSFSAVDQWNDPWWDDSKRDTNLARKQAHEALPLEGCNHATSLVRFCCTGLLVLEEVSTECVLRTIVMLL